MLLLCKGKSLREFLPCGLIEHLRVDLDLLQDGVQDFEWGLWKRFLFFCFPPCFLRLLTSSWRVSNFWDRSLIQWLLPWPHFWLLWTCARANKKAKVGIRVWDFVLHHILWKAAWMRKLAKHRWYGDWAFWIVHNIKMLKIYSDIHTISKN